MLHDAGLSERFRGPYRFEVDGANAARAFLSERGANEHMIDTVWDAIALHSTPDVPAFKQPEVALLDVGLALDVSGRGKEQLPDSDVREILEAAPRLDFKSAFIAACAEIAREKPQSTMFTFVSDIGRRAVPGFQIKDAYDVINDAPYES